MPKTPSPYEPQRRHAQEFVDILRRINADPSLVAIAERVRDEIAPAQEPGCLDCGLPYSQFPLDVILPRSQWLEIYPAENGLLCAACIMRRLIRRIIVDGAIWRHDDDTQRYENALADQHTAALRRLVTDRDRLLAVLVDVAAEGCVRYRSYSHEATLLHCGRCYACRAREAVAASLQGGDARIPARATGVGQHG